MPRSIVITVPHARCPKAVKGHECDTAALQVARDLEAGLRRRGVQVQTFVGDLPRTECDLNRSSCRETPFRRKVRAALDRCRNGCLLVDVHSRMPESTERYGRDDLTFLHRSGNETVIAAARDRIRRGSTRGVSSNVVPGSTTNDLVEESFELGVPAVLVEANEGAGDRLPVLGAALADGFVG